MKSKRKGAGYEREVAAVLRNHGYDARRTAQYCGNTGDASDVVGLPYVHIECKRYANRAFDYDWIEQAKRDSIEASKKTGSDHYDIPIVIHRTDNHKSLVTLYLDDFMDIYREYEAGIDLDQRQV